MPAAVTRAACTTSGAPLEGPRCPEISRQAQYLRTFDIYCLSEQTTTRTAVVQVQVVQVVQTEARNTYLCTLPLPKKEDGPPHTQTHTSFSFPIAHRHMHTCAPHPHHITQMGHILGFTIRTPHHNHNRMRAQSVQIALL